MNAREKLATRQEFDPVQLAAELENAGLSVMIGTPCYGGTVTANYLQSIVQFSSLASTLPVRYWLATVTAESLVTRARNKTVHKFIHSDASHLMFIDSDIGFDAVDIFRFLAMDKDVVCGAYPLKGYDWETLVQSKPSNGEEARRFALQTFLPVGGKVDESTGLFPAVDVGTGFMMIARRVFEKLAQSHPEWRYQLEDNYDDAKEDQYAFFDCEISEGRYLSEDYTFARRAKREGFEVLVDPSVRLTHSGMHTFG